MLHKTRGIVFKYFKYRDTSIIAKILTEKLGLQTYIVNGIRSKNARGKIALFQPLSLLDLIVYYKPNAEINRISEVKSAELYQNMPYKVIKSSIGVFLAEVLYKSVKEEGEITEMFRFIYDSMIILDQLETGFENFHLQFMLKFTKYLGFGIDSAFMQEVPLLESNVRKLLFARYDEHINISNEDRRSLLNLIIGFYKTHIDSFGELKSVNVLQEVL
ncbi:DNA repair protein RecO [Fulvivirga sp. M361]|uniref:DNA repair protein RecO n=1 Tax=Fulvivirga sp. M361 TaxID=2594266 RepID=UPI00117B0B3C|nr:DNA repair protein RecO [Fulvivirga sp. M361]TRX53740.1 DNA repair protein RecO [Fulvivirga sp. M361]